MSGKIYLDNSATTPLCESAISAMTGTMQSYGNPSSLHSMGVEAEKLVSEARKNILATLGIRYSTKLDGRQLIFTASGTEADNLAIIGAAMAKNFKQTKKILTSDSEHPGVLEPMKYLERNGFEIIRIPTIGGAPDYEMIERVADENMILASFMLINNETGAIYDIKRISDIVKLKNPEALVHTDCVQGYLKLQFTPKSLGADLITLSSHKINGPKGVGALYVSPEVIKAKKLSPIIFGGGQEFALRSGTENVIGIVGFGAAAKYSMEHLTETAEKERKLRERLIQELQNPERFPKVKLNLPGNAAAHILSITLPDIKSEVMLHSLSSEGIFVSSGSACSSNSGHGSYVLTSFGLTDHEADCTIRVSLGYQNTEEEIEYFLERLENSMKRLVRMNRGRR